jgi:hypothetical protein
VAQVGELRLQALQRCDLREARSGSVGTPGSETASMKYGTGQHKDSTRCTSHVSSLLHCLLLLQQIEALA